MMLFIMRAMWSRLTARPGRRPRTPRRLPAPGADWQLFARSGSDAFRPQVRGTYIAEKKYRCLDIVARDGSSFIARRDFRGACPVEDWQLLAGTGPTDPQSPQGEKGDSGPSGKLPSVNPWRAEIVFYQ